jgi:hypothetical protein
MERQPDRVARREYSAESTCETIKALAAILPKPVSFCPARPGQSAPGLFSSLVFAPLRLKRPPPNMAL